METPHIRPTPKSSSATQNHKQNQLFKTACCVKNGSSDSPNSSSSSAPDNKFGFKLVGQSLGEKNWKFNDIDASEFPKQLLCVVCVCVDELDFCCLWAFEQLKLVYD